MFIIFRDLLMLTKFPFRHKWNEAWLLVINWYTYELLHESPNGLRLRMLGNWEISRKSQRFLSIPAHSNQTTRSSPTRPSRPHHPKFPQRRPATPQKGDSGTGVFLRIFAKFLRKPFLTKHLRWLLLKATYFLMFF